MKLDRSRGWPVADKSIFGEVNIGILSTHPDRVAIQMPGSKTIRSFTVELALEIARDIVAAAEEAAANRAKMAAPTGAPVN